MAKEGSELIFLTSLLSLEINLTNIRYFSLQEFKVKANKKINSYSIQSVRVVR